MDKNTIVKVLTVIVVLFFIFEMFALGYIGQPSNQQNIPTGSSSTVGIAEIDVTIKSFEPYLISQKLSEQEINKLKLEDGVEDVLLTDRGYVISLKTSKYMSTIFSILKSDNVSSTAVANIILPNSFEIKLDSGGNASVVSSGSQIKLSMEPFAHEGEQIRIKMSVETQNGVLYKYSPPTISPVQVTFEAMVKIGQKLFALHSLSIPWNKRNQIDVLLLQQKYGADNVSYIKKDYVSLGRNLTSTELVSKKYAYISYINENSITVPSNYTNVGQILNDFDKPSFPTSLLQIKTTGTIELPFEDNVSYFYLVTPINSSYGFTNNNINLEMNQDNFTGEVKLSVNALVVGKSVLNVLSVKKI